MLKKTILTLVTLLLASCGFQFQNGELIPQELQTLRLESNDPYSDMSMSMRKQLQLSNVKLVETKSGVPVLRLNKIKTDDEVVSVFKQGRAAEKVLMLEVNATLSFPNNKSFPITAKVSRTFFDNSRAALAKSAEKEVLMKDMHEQAARQLISKMVALQHQTETK